MKRSKIPKQLLTISLAIAIIFANFTMPVQTFAEASVTPEAAMENYLNEKIITSGGENVVKKDNLTYDIGLKTTSNSPINSVRFRDASDGYKAAWKVDPSSAEYLNAKALYTAPSKSILKRPAADEGAFPAKVTVMLYEESTSKSDINSGAAAPLASQDVTINLLPDNPVYNVTFEAVNSKTKKPVTNAVIKVEKDWNTVTPEEGGIYKMTAGDVFNVTAEAPGYKKYINSSFTATASGKVSLPIDEIITKNITFNVKDEKGTPVKNPEITVKKGGSRISAQSDGTYKLEVGQKYSYTITADGFNDVTDTITLSETSSETIEVEMTAAVFHKVTFKISDKKGPVTGAGITVREGYNDVSPESDGSYMLKEGIEYKYTVNKSGYETKTESFTVTENTEISVVLSKTIYKYLVNINPVDSQGKTISNATVKVEYYDDYDWEYYEVEPESGTTYELYPSTEYTISVSAPGYTSKTISSYTPSGDDEEIDYKITLIKKESPDQGKVDAVKKQFDNELGALRPSFKTDPNINTFVLNKIKGYSGLDTSGITVELASADSNVIGTDGTIHYITNSLNPYGGVNSENVSCTFKIKCGSAEAVTLSRTVTVGWDQNYFNEKIKADRDSMTIDRILGSNKDKNNITSDLTLPRCTGSNLRQVWSVADWATSDPSVISLEKPSPDSAIYPLTGKIHPQSADKEVTLTATFKANDTVLNTYVEKVSDFETYTVSFTVTVKGTAPPAPTESELLAILDKYYTTDLITDAITDKPADLNNLKDDILLPRYTKIKDENAKLVFKNKEITVTSENTDALSITGYRGNVDPFQKGSKSFNLVVTFTRSGVTVTKKIPVKVITITDAELDAEIQMMNSAKANYFNGINNNTYDNASSVTGNLHAFMEMRLDTDGTPVWAYSSDKVTGDGIVPDSFFEDPWEMESAGYNKFKSSKPDIIKHDNLLVTRPENSTVVNVSSLLSSAKYGKYAPLHPENKKLQMLYKQEVSVDITVKGTKTAEKSFNEALKAAAEFAETIKEGAEPGNYPEGSKKVITDAINSAKDINVETASESDLEKAAETLYNTIEKVKKTQNPVIAEDVVISGKYKNNVPAVKFTADVKSNEAEKAGYYKEDKYRNKVTAIDVMVVLHRHIFGKDFDANPEKYLLMSNNGFTSKIFGIETGYSYFLVNDIFPSMPEDPETSCVANNAVIASGDRFALALLSDTKQYSDTYLYFTEDAVTANQLEEFTLTLKGYQPFVFPSEGPALKEGYTVTVTSEDGATAQGVTNNKGEVKFKLKNSGIYTATVTAVPENMENHFIPSISINIKVTPANYAAVDNAMKKVPTDLSIYTEDSVTALQNAIDAVTTGLDITKQTQVNAFAADIEAAVKNLVIRPADYSAVDDAMKKVPADLSIYTKDSVTALQNAIDAVTTGLDITKQEQVNAFAADITAAVNALVEKDIHTDIDTEISNTGDNNNSAHKDDSGKTEENKSPVTGDTSDFAIWFILLSASVLIGMKKHKAMK